MGMGDKISTTEKLEPIEKKPYVINILILKIKKKYTIINKRKLPQIIWTKDHIWQFFYTEFEELELIKWKVETKCF